MKFGGLFVPSKLNVQCIAQKKRKLQFGRLPTKRAGISALRLLFLSVGEWQARQGKHLPYQDGEGRRTASTNVASINTEQSEKERIVTTEQEHLESDCTHHWVLGRPNGPTSEGVCKICGDRSEFPNSITRTGWENDNPQRQRARQTRGKQAPQSQT